VQGGGVKRLYRKVADRSGTYDPGHSGRVSDRRKERKTYARCQACLREKEACVKGALARKAPPREGERSPSARRTAGPSSCPDARAVQERTRGDVLRVRPLPLRPLPVLPQVRRDGSYIIEEFVATGGTDVKVYTVGPR
jgi:hypothetical protein